MEGWFNTDYFPRQGMPFLDVTKPFPFPANTFDFVYSEHHIEHISYKDAVKMLVETFRVLKSEGIVRIATPDLRRYIESYITDSDALLIKKHAEDWR